MCETVWYAQSDFLGLQDTASRVIDNDNTWFWHGHINCSDMHAVYGYRVVSHDDCMYT